MNMRSILFVTALAVGLAAGVSAPANATNLIVNGSFEANPFNGSGMGWTSNLTGNDVTGWFIPAASNTFGDPRGWQNSNAIGAGPAADGNQWLVIGSSAGAQDLTIQQTIHGLTPGQSYDLTFDIAAQAGVSYAEVSFLNGSSTAAQDFTTPDSQSYFTKWGLNTYTFVATANSATVQFKDLIVEHASEDLGLDNVSLLTTGAVPEPGAWAMMLVGFAGIGLIARRRSAKPSLAAA